MASDLNDDEFQKLLREANIDLIKNSPQEIFNIPKLLDRFGDPARPEELLAELDRKITNSILADLNALTRDPWDPPDEPFLYDGKMALLWRQHAGRQRVEVVFGGGDSRCTYIATVDAGTGQFPIANWCFV